MNTTEAPIAPEVASAPVPTPAKASKAKKAKALKDTKPASSRAMEIVNAAKLLAGICTAEKIKLDGFEFRSVEKVRGMHVLRVPSFKEAVKKLPHSDEGKSALNLVKGLSEAVNALTGGPSHATWVVRETGSFTLFSRFSEVTA